MKNLIYILETDTLISAAVIGTICGLAILYMEITARKIK